MPNPRPYITIIVKDTPRPGGSKTVGFSSKTGKGFVRPANKHTATWRDSVRAAAFHDVGSLLDDHTLPTSKPLEVTHTFYFKRPASHYGSGKNSGVLKPNAPKYHTKTPDLTKVIRSTEDALTGIVWVDDCQVVRRTDEKCYADLFDHEGVVLKIQQLE